MGEDKEKDSRRRFMKMATVAVGGAMGLVAGVPLVRYFLHPVGRRLVSTPDEPIDIAAVADLKVGAPPVRLPVVASGVRDAWGILEDVSVGSCWVSKDENGSIKAFSSVCPHLGCAVSFDEGSDEYKCPCHTSAFKRNGERRAGPAKRGLDPLEVVVEDGRVKVVYKRFRADIAEREVV